MEIQTFRLRKHKGETAEGEEMTIWTFPLREHKEKPSGFTVILADPARDPLIN